MKKFQDFLKNIEDLVEHDLIPCEQEVEDSDAIPQRLVLKMKKLGLFGITIPEIYGGLDVSIEEQVEVMFALGKTSPVFWMLVGTNQGIGGQSILLGGSEQQKNYYLPKLAKGELISSFALTEENAGSDACSIQTIAEKNSGGWILNGKKQYITNAIEAGVFVVLANTNKSSEKKEISAFIVEAGTKGLIVKERYPLNISG